MFLILVIILFTKFRRSNTLDTWFHSYLLKYTKLAIIFSAWIVDTRLCVWTILSFGILLLIGPNPPNYSGPTQVKEIGMEYFKKYIDNKEESNPELTYIVHLYSVTAETCTWFESEFARVSLHYGYPGSSVIFASISLDTFPSLIDQFQLLTPSMNRFEHELPTILMFEGGRVKARLPEIGKKMMMDEINIVRAMDLDNRARVDPVILAQLEKKTTNGKAASATATPTEATNKQTKKTK